MYDINPVAYFLTTWKRCPVFSRDQTFVKAEEITIKRMDKFPYNAATPSVYPSSDNIVHCFPPSTTAFFHLVHSWCVPPKLSYPSSWYFVSLFSSFFLTRLASLIVHPSLECSKTLLIPILIAVSIPGKVVFALTKRPFI